MLAVTYSDTLDCNDVVTQKCEKEKKENVQNQIGAQGPEEFCVNKWITYLKPHLEKCLYCRLAWSISPMGSLWIYCKRFLRFLSDPVRLCCSPFWKSITASHIVAGARHVARRATGYCKPILRALSLLGWSIERVTARPVTRGGAWGAFAPPHRPQRSTFWYSISKLRSAVG